MSNVGNFQCNEGKHHTKEEQIRQLLHCTEVVTRASGTKLRSPLAITVGRLDGMYQLKHSQSKY